MRSQSSEKLNLQYSQPHRLTGMPTADLLYLDASYGNGNMASVCTEVTKCGRRVSTCVYGRRVNTCVYGRRVSTCAYGRRVSTCVYGRRVSTCVYG